VAACFEFGFAGADEPALEEVSFDEGGYVSLRVSLFNFSMEQVLRVITRPTLEEDSHLNALLETAERKALAEALAEVGQAFEELDETQLTTFNRVLIGMVNSGVLAQAMWLRPLSPQGFPPGELLELVDDEEDYELLRLALWGRLPGEQAWEAVDHSYAFFSPDEVQELHAEVEGLSAVETDLETDLEGELLGPLAGIDGRWLLVRRS
jgi:hypothetical protein